MNGEEYAQDFRDAINQVRDVLGAAAIHQNGSRAARDVLS
jgi:hypothetical protein